MLTPYDVLRMKKALGIDSSEFLEQYTSIAYSAEKQVPVVFLKMNEDDKKCPFVGEKGCGVYAQPPVGMPHVSAGNGRAGNFAGGRRAILLCGEGRACHGHGKGAECTVRECIDGQGVEPYDVMQAPFRRLLALAAEQQGSADGRPMRHVLHGLYDLDRFRRFVFETRFLNLFDVDEARVRCARTDDEELLELAIEWLAFSLFHKKRCG